MTATAILGAKTCIGIYLIRCSANGKTYVGSTTNFVRRNRTHWRELGRGTHINRSMQSAWDKYGEGSFTFEIVIRCNVDELHSNEQRLIDEMATAVTGFNIAKSVVAPMIGRHHSDSTRRAMSKRREGIEFSAETIAALKAAAVANREQTSANSRRMWACRSDDEKAAISLKIAEKNTGRKRSPDVLEKFQKVALALWQTDEHKTKMLKAQSNRKTPVWTDEAKRIHKEKVTAYQNSEECRAAKSALHKGRKRSPETKARMSMAALTREARYRVQKAAQI